MRKFATIAFRNLALDINYLNIVGDKLKIIEEKYTFTTKEDMEWTNNQKLNKSEIEKEYMNFINKNISSSCFIKVVISNDKDTFFAVS